jgi:HPr kinase/phosphorylase
MKGRQVQTEPVRVSVSSFAKELELEVIKEGRGEIELSSISVSRPGLQLSGYFVHFDRTRVQVIGNAENEFLLGMTAEKRYNAIENLLKRQVPCLIFSRSLRIFPEVIELCEKYNCPLLRSEKITTVLINDITAYKSEALAPTHVAHGVLVDIYGIGILIVGKSGVGKSEIALDLVNRGHRLVADDSVIIKNINDRLIGKSPANIRYYMEIRGIGIINIQQMFGPGAISPSKSIDILAELSPWEEGKSYERLGTEESYEEILGEKILKVTIPVTPGRNIPIVLETAARHYRLKQAGYDAAADLMKSVFGETK